MYTVFNSDAGMKSMQ